MKLASNLPSCVSAYLDSINGRTPESFLSAFSPDAVVHDIGREIRGHAAIKHWADQEIFAANVTLELLSVIAQGDEITLTVKVDGTFDKTGLPDPLVMAHTLKLEDQKIIYLACHLAPFPAAN